MPLKFDFKRVYSSLSERVKSTDIHPQEPWILVALYNGQVHIHNYEQQSVIKSFDCGQIPVRASIFVSRKNWVIAGSDDLIIRIFNYNTLEKVHQFEAHVDYIRSIISHNTKPILVSCSDDMTIKLWDWENRFANIMVFEGHHHYVMQVVFNPKDANQLCSASLDKKIKIWNMMQSKASYTLEGHDKGVNSVDYCNSGDKPYLISASDDWNIKIWDYQNKTCVHTLTGHSNNVIRAIFHPNLPLIISISEDGYTKIWNNSTFRCESSLNYGMGRMWTISTRKDSNEFVLGYDDGIVMIRAGREAPTCSMDNSGKIFISKQNHISQTNTKNIESEMKDGEKLSIPFTEMGTCEIYPQSLVCSPNGRFLAVLGDGEFVIYTTIALRSKFFANGDRFAWSNDSSSFVVKDNSYLVLYKNFKEYKRINPKIQIEDIFSGELIGIRTSNEVHFYEWSELNFIIVIDVLASTIVWNSDSTLCCLCESNTVHFLKYNAEAVQEALNNSQLTERGLENAFEPFSQVSECVLSGYWIADCFIFTTKNNRICYIIGEQLFSISHTERPSFIIGYVANFNRLFLIDKEGNIITYHLDMRIIELQIAVLNKDFDNAKTMLSTIPQNSLNQISLFLENQELLSLAMEVTTDLDHKFDLAIRLKDFNKAYEFAKEINNSNKWKILAKTCTQASRFDIAIDSYRRLKDPSALFMISNALNDSNLLAETLEIAKEQKNFYIQFVIYYTTGRVCDAIDLLKSCGMDSHAALMAYSYVPDRVDDTFNNWITNLKKVHPKQAEQLADPSKYPNLFQGFHKEDIEDKFEKMSLKVEDEQ